MVVATSGDGGKTWEEVLAIDPDGQLWVFWAQATPSAGTWSPVTEGSARMVVSTDKGETWHLRGAASVPNDVRSFDEHIIVERKDKSFWMLVRTKYGIGESLSTYSGRKWRTVPFTLSYDYNRKADQHILMESFTEDDVISGNPDSETVSLRRLVSKGGVKTAVILE